MSTDGVRPAEDRPATETTVPKPRRWQPDPRNVLALDRHIAKVYGPEHVRPSRP